MSLSVLFIDVIAILVVSGLTITSLFFYWKKREKIYLFLTFISFLNFIAHIEVSSFLRFWLMESDNLFLKHLFSHLTNRKVFFFFSVVKSVCWIGMVWGWVILYQRRELE